VPPHRSALKQSIAYWCFNLMGDRWSLDRICEVAQELGCASVELVNSVDELKVIEKHGLTCALLGLDMAPDPPFVYGLNNPDHWPRVFRQTKAGIDAASDYGCPNMIAFTGYAARQPSDPRSPLISSEEGASNCIRGLQELVVYAAAKNVTLCLEPLSTRDNSHPMKGHPGYQGNHVDYCVDIIKSVDSPHLKLLFDIYHTQVMDGDLLRRIRSIGNLIGHVHTAGNPGRGELDDTQEIAFRPLMQALVDIGYRGYVGHEYIPTRDPYQSLQEAVALCGSV
jgi:hydroxypyruvate isomerase